MENQKKKIGMIIVFLIGIIIGALVVWGVGQNQKATEGYIPSFRIIGDVTEVQTIQTLPEEELVTFEYEEESFKGIPVSQLLEKAVPWTENSTVVYVGNDGLTAEVDGQTLDKAYCLYSEENGWELIHLQHPVSSNIKHLKEIVVVSQEEIHAKTHSGFTIFSDHENLDSFTPGQMYMMGYQLEKNLEGESNIQNNFVRIYTTHRILDMQKLLRQDHMGLTTEGKESIEETGMLFMNDGRIVSVTLDGFLDMVDNQIQYVSYEKKYQYEDVVGLYIGDPKAYVGDVYYDMEYYIEKEEPVMLIFIDGFNIETYKEAVKRGIIPNISNGEMEEAFSVHTSVTNAGFASMITGQTPDVNGVHNRDHRDLKVDTIFAVAKEKQCTTAFLEGDIRILNTEIPPVLHVNGDMEILESVGKAVEDKTDFIFAHLHELDNMGHSFGPNDERLYAYLEGIDLALGEILEEYEGKVIITTDHGMHEEGIAGNHGSMRYEDMIIPIIRH